MFEVGEFDGPVFVAMDVAAVSSAGDQAMLRLERRARARGLDRDQRVAS